MLRTYMSDTEAARKAGEFVEIGEEELWAIIQAAWLRCKREVAGADNRGSSSQWVNFLAEEFNKRIISDTDQSKERVFWRGRPDDQNKDEFGLQELLFDILVCRTEANLVDGMETPTSQLRR